MMEQPHKRMVLRIVMVLMSWCGGASWAAPAKDALVEGFHTPPEASKPRVWWHWMGGNVTEEGVKLDLEWMKRIGIGGITHFDASFEGWGAGFDIPPQIEKPLIYLSPEWQRALRYSVDLANQLGLEFSIASSPGFSETGGPWVQPRQAMKKLVWSEAVIRGGVAFRGHLAQPPETTGLFQNVPLIVMGAHDPENSKTPVYYGEVATLAFRAPESQIEFSKLKPEIISSAGAIDEALLSDGDLSRSIVLPFGQDRLAWIRFSFPKPQKIKSVTAVFGRPLTWDPLRESGPRGWLEASDDGHTFRKFTELPSSGALQQTVSFAPIVAR
jgi:hypothetical protein